MDYYPILEVKNPIEQPPASGDAVDLSPLAPDELTGCLMWLDATQGLETSMFVDGNGVEYQGVVGWTDRTGNYKFEPSYSQEFAPRSENGYVQSGDYGDHSMSAPASLIDPNAVQDTITITVGAAEEIYTISGLFDPSAGYLSVSGGAFEYTNFRSDIEGATLDDIRIGGVSVFSDPEMSANDYGSYIDFSYYPYDFKSGSVEFVFSRTPMIEFPIVGQSTMIFSVATTDENAPIIDISETVSIGYVSGSIGLRERFSYHSNGTSVTYENYAVFPPNPFKISAVSSNIGKLSEYSEIMANMTCTALEGREGEYATRHSGIASSKFQDVRPRDLRLFSPYDISGVRHSSVSIFDIVAFNRVLPQTDIERVCKYLAQKRSM